ncbi:MAG: multidrug effflux MFS transporter [Campylobacter sp.]
MDQTKNLSKLEFIALMALLTSLTAMSIDSILPALTQIGTALKVSPNQTQLIISSVFGGFAIGQIFYGPLSDFIGRRYAIIFSLIIFIIGSFISAITTNFDALLFSRFLQGLGAAGPEIIAIALIRDTCKGRQMASIMSFVKTVFIITPVLAPSVGAAVLKISNWQSIFLLLTVMGLISLVWFGLRQSETLPKSKRQKFSKECVRADILQVLANKRVMGYTVITGLVFGVFLSYLSTVGQIFESSYKAGEFFPIYFALNALAIGAASIINAKFVVRLGMRFFSIRAMIAFCVIAAIFTPITFIFDGIPPLFAFMTFCMCSLFCTSILFGNLNAMIMEPMGHIAGMAAALTGCISTLIALPIGTFIGQLYDTTLIPMITSFLIIGIISLVLLLKISKIPDDNMWFKFRRSSRPD